MYRGPKFYYVYIMTNRSKTLYTGMTSNLEARVWQHKNHVYKGFASKYKVDRLAYFEQWPEPGLAIGREKQIKGWTRIKKIALIVSKNPEWKDLSEEWGKPLPPLVRKELPNSNT
ncbi:MAG TPA: GIY-YIG nuclease family protein [Terriglobales bacterium]|nr:GIY-YIG nuclease family protein [Terriglobales bacterium]